MLPAHAELYIASLLGVLALAVSSNRKPTEWTGLKVLIFILALVYPLLFSLDKTVLIGSAALFLGCFLEFRYPRHPMAPGDTENVLSSTFSLVRRPLQILFSVFILTKLQTVWPVTLNWNSLPDAARYLLAFLVVDFKSYWLHRGQHYFDLWWGFHKLHHGTEKLSLLAADRDHLLEVFLTEQLTTVIIAFFFGLPPEIFAFCILLPQQLIGAYLGHINLKSASVKMQPWQYVIISPSVHAEHHRITEEKCNYGTVLPLWDFIFDTFRAPMEKPLKFGLAETETTGILEQHLAAFKTKKAVLRQPSSTNHNESGNN